MARLNVRQHDGFVPHEAGAVQKLAPVAELRRLVSCCLLGEDQFYLGGQQVKDLILARCAEVDCVTIADIALEARTELGLRHVPLLLLVHLTWRHDGGAKAIARVAGAILRTPKDAMDLVALNWGLTGKPGVLPNSFKRAIRDSFARWSEYQLQKYATLDKNVSVRLRDLMFLTHANPNVFKVAKIDPLEMGGFDATLSHTADAREALFRSIADDTVRAPDTWESALSVPGADKRAVWERLLSENKLGALALVRNLRNMESVGVTPALVIAAMERVKAADVWPWQALAAAREAPAYGHALDTIMLRSAGSLPRLPGDTGVLVDLSGSMDAGLSAKGTMKRRDAACGLAVVLREVCASMSLATFTTTMQPMLGHQPRGTTLAQKIAHNQPAGGTNLGLAVRDFLAGFPNVSRLVVLTDEQAQDTIATRPGVPIYVVNLASTQRGMDWHGPVTRINGWSGGVIRWLAQEVAGSAGAPEGWDEVEA